VVGTGISKEVVDQIQEVVSRRVPTGMIYEAQRRTIDAAQKKGDAGLAHPGRRQWAYALGVLRNLEAEAKAGPRPPRGGVHPSFEIVGWDAA
jgi:transcription initiation factor TFIID subunit TAF12